MAEIFETLIRDSDKVISIVGGGGKTSLMFLLAHALREKGLKVVTTTTTRILKPTSQQTGGVIFLNRDDFQDQLQDCLKQNGHATVAHHLLPSGNKLQGVTCAQVGQIFNHSSIDRMVIEADGARQLSFKAPGDNEPVVPQITDVLISVIGLDIIDKSLTEANVFRAELVAERTGLNLGDKITPLAVAQLVTHQEGLLKGCPKKACSYVFLNKTDIPGARENAFQIIDVARQQQGKQPDFWIVGSVQNNVCSLLG